ncbi:MAG: O-antigen ligase family protein [Paraclostridium sp.]
MNIAKSQNIKNLEMIIFIMGVVLQCFSILTIGGSGIPFLLIVCLIFYIKYKFYNKVNIAFIIISVLIGVRTLSDRLVMGTPIVSIIRLFMVIFISYVSFRYISLIYKEKNQKRFYKIYIGIFFLLNLYGIYSMFSMKLNLPLFMNIFINNPSYAVKETVFSYVSGWVDDMRIYTTFSEPSFYAFFLCINLFIIKNLDIKFKEKLVMYSLLAINLYNTYSRSGYVIFIQFIIVMFGFKLVSKIIKSKKHTFIILITIVLLVPFINLGIMNFANENIFNDLSSESRTKSGVYYLNKSFEDTSSLLIGHGYKSIALGYNQELQSKDIEGFAHNAYIEIIYEFGWVFFILFMMLIVIFINKEVDSYEYKLQIVTIIAMLSSSVTFYNIESIISLISIFIASAKFSKCKKFNT